MNTLGTLGGSYSEAWAINAAGEVVGAASSTQAGSRPFLYRNGMMQDLGTLDRSASSNGAAFAINAAGHVTGWSQAADGRLHPFLYGDGVMTDLGSLGGQLASGTSINSSDQVTGWAQAANGEYRAFLYSNGVLTDLGPCGCGVGAVLAINSLGQVVGFGDSLYSDGVTRNLNTLIPSGSNWSLDIAVAINDKGQITGEGNHADEPRAFLMTPVIRVPRTKDECKKGGWADLARAIGTAFKNQGDCVSYVNTGK
jgi:probable HAF family extracellular repeat protein